MEKYDEISLIQDCDKLQDSLIRTNWETKENKLKTKMEMVFRDRRWTEEIIRFCASPSRKIN